MNSHPWLSPARLWLYAAGAGVDTSGRNLQSCSHDDWAQPEVRISNWRDTQPCRSATEPLPFCQAFPFCHQQNHFPPSPPPVFSPLSLPTQALSRDLARAALRGACCLPATTHPLICVFPAAWFRDRALLYICRSAGACAISSLPLWGLAFSTRHTLGDILCQEPVLWGALPPQQLQHSSARLTEASAG